MKVAYSTSPEYPRFGQSRTGQSPLGSGHSESGQSQSGSFQSRSGRSKKVGTIFKYALLCFKSVNKILSK